MNDSEDLKYMEDLMLVYKKSTEMKHIRSFVTESNLIEGIKRKPTKNEIDIHKDLFAANTVTLKDLTELVEVCTGRGKMLRCEETMDVVIVDGSGCIVWAPPVGGTEIVNELSSIIKRAHDPKETPYGIHLDYESLHPYMDGNGRSGRFLWAWMMIKRGIPFVDQGFLHTWYYQSLKADRKGLIANGK